jgi:molecular chaperone GrpE (heat shock protein)
VDADRVSEKHEPEQERSSPSDPVECNGGKSADDQPAQEQPTPENVEEDSSTPKDPQLIETLTEISAELSALNSTVENRLRYDKLKEEAFERLYAELEELKRDAAFQNVRPLYSDLILFFDRIESTRLDLAQSTPEASSLSYLLETLCDELLEILLRREVETIQTTLSTFDPTVQRAIGTEAASIEADNNQVARVVRKGFKYRDRILRAEEVIVKKYSESNGEAVG